MSLKTWFVPGVKSQYIHQVAKLESPLLRFSAENERQASYKIWSKKPKASGTAVYKAAHKAAHFIPLHLYTVYHPPSPPPSDFKNYYFIQKQQ